MLLEKPRFASILKESVQFPDHQIHLVMCYSVLEIVLFDLVNVAYIHPLPGPRATLSCGGPWVPFHFPCGFP